MWIDYWQLALKSITHRKMRSWLTMLGIFVGVAAIVSLISLGQGLQVAINEEFEKIGADKLFIQPKGVFGPPGSQSSVPLTKDDLKVIQNSRGVEKATGFTVGSGQVEFQDEIGFFVVSGLPLDEEGRRLLDEVNSYGVAIGRELRQGDRNKATMGLDFHEKNLIGREMNLRDSFTLNGVEFKIVGFWERIGNPSDDRTIYIPIETYDELFQEQEELDAIVAKVKAGSDPRQTAENIERELRNHRNLDKENEDFVVETPEQVLESFQTFLNIIQVVLVGIAAISLVVGGIGIMNTMFTSVLERTREIGIMKAVGAKNKDILLLFLIESGVIGLIGGIIGTVIGLSLSLSAEYISTTIFGSSLVKAYMGAELILGAILFAFVVGVVSGTLPAKNAANLSPVEALSHRR